MDPTFKDNNINSPEISFYVNSLISFWQLHRLESDWNVRY